MDGVAAPVIWGFALEGALDVLQERFVELTKEGRCDWVLIPVRGARLSRLRVPDGFLVTGGPLS